MSREADIQRASRAKAILDEPVFKEACEHIEAELWRKFKEVLPSDIEALTQIKGMQYLHIKYLAFLQSAINSGTIARIELERAQPRPKGY